MNVSIDRSRAWAQTCWMATRKVEPFAAANLKSQSQGAVGATPKNLDTASPLVSAPRGEAVEDLPEILANCGHGFVKL